MSLQHAVTAASVPAPGFLNKKRMPQRISVARASLRGAWSTAGSVKYGLVAQSCSSATNFGLVIIAGHVLGASGVGVLLVGFSVYLILLGFQRALLTEPLLTASSARELAERVAGTRSAITLTFAALLPASLFLAGVGLAVPAPFGRGILLFAPWVVPALVQDMGRSVVFRDRLQASTTFSDAIWLVTMAVTAPLAFASGSDWAVVGCWGAGSVSGALVVLIQIRWTPTSLRFALSWWESDARRFGRWLAMQALLYNTASLVSLVVVAGVLGARDYGGFRAVQALFAPLTLLGPAVALPGLPLVARKLKESSLKALRAAAQFAALIAILTAAYVVVLYGFPRVLGFFFGESFIEFRSLLVPIGIGQIILAPSFGLTLFLKAQQRGRVLLWVATLYAFMRLSFVTVLALLFGLNGAAWAVAAAAVLYEAALFAVIRSDRASRTGATR